MKPTNFAAGVALVACVCATPAFATENGSDNSIGLGAEGVLAGALPPPGLYGLLYVNEYDANRFVDGHGNSLIPNFKLDATAIVPRVVYMTNTSIAGGLFGVYGLVPLVNLKVHAAGQSDSRTGIGDTAVAPMIAWHHGDLHWATAMEFVLPTGDYDKNRLANIGNNYYTVRPTLAVSYSDPNGLDISTRLMYSINSTNNATGYHSGEYVAADYSVGYRVKPTLTLAVEGYLLKQLTDDRVDGASVNGNGFRGQVFGIGPGIHYQGKGFSIEAKFIKETLVRNRSDGTSAWIKAIIPF